MQQEIKICQNCANSFTIEPEDFDFYKKIGVPPPTFCPKCRLQRRAAFRNDRKIFWVKSGLSGKKILSLYAPSFGYTIYSDEEWRSDVWDPLKYGRDVNFSRPFLEQIAELAKVVPMSAISCINMVNSEYSGNADGLKNCYLMFNSNHTEDSAYGNGVDNCRACFDNSHLQNSERCYNSFWLTNCYATHFSSRGEDCRNAWFLKDCRGCSDCAACVNLRMKKYCIFNEQYSKEEYHAKLKELELHKRSKFLEFEKRAREFWNKFPNKYLQGAHNTNVSGEFITHSKNVRESYLIRESEDLKYCQYSQVPSSKSCFDCTLIGQTAELLYESCVAGWHGYGLKFCYECWNGARDLEYCMYCKGLVSNLFGCVGMKNGEYCILNKQYSKKEYEELVPKIKKHMNDMPYQKQMVDPSTDSTSSLQAGSGQGGGRLTYRYGEFFPPEFSPIAYNHSTAPEHFPLSREEALRQGFMWLDDEQKEYQTTMPADNLTDDIFDLDEAVLKEIIQCGNCKKGYRIISDELQFLKQSGIPAPSHCVDCRHNARISQRNPAIFYKRTCACRGSKSENGTYSNITTHLHGSDPCPNEFQTSYPLDRPEIVYCENCYNSEVI